MSTSILEFGAREYVRQSRSFNENDLRRRVRSLVDPPGVRPVGEDLSAEFEGIVVKELGTGAFIRDRESEGRRVEILLCSAIVSSGFAGHLLCDAAGDGCGGWTLICGNWHSSLSCSARAAGKFAASVFHSCGTSSSVSLASAGVAT